MGNKQASELAKANQQSTVSVGGKNLINEALMFKTALIWTIAEAERLKGAPANTPEIAVVYQENYSRLIMKGQYFNAFLQNFYREDLFFADKQFTCWSLTGPDGTEERKTLEKFSDRFRRLFPGYVLDKKMHVVAGPTTTTINLKQLIGLLRSKDADLWERNKWAFDGNFRILDGEANYSQKVAFCSIPRSGNTFLRKYMEMLTGIYTGADNTLHVNINLQM